MPTLPSRSPVTEVATLPSADAWRHFSRLLELETDCWDVHASLAAGGFVLLDVRSPAICITGPDRELNRGPGANRQRAVVADRRRLPDLPAQLSRLERRRRRRSPGHHFAARSSGFARRACHLDLALLSVADEGLRLR